LSDRRRSNVPGQYIWPRIQKKNGTLANMVSRRSRAAPSNAADAPLGLRIAATMTSVSNTNLFTMLDIKSYHM
jgi:hypothetical protein